MRVYSTNFQVFSLKKLNNPFPNFVNAGWSIYGSVKYHFNYSSRVLWPKFLVWIILIKESQTHNILENVFLENYSPFIHHPSLLKPTFSFSFQRRSNFPGSYRYKTGEAIKSKYWCHPRGSNPLTSAREAEAIEPTFDSPTLPPAKQTSVG